VEALMTTSVIRYLGEVLNGGHGQYFGNTQCNPWEMDACENGLVAVDASDYLSIFRRARALIDTDLDRGYRIAAGGGFGKIDAEVRGLSEELFDLDEDELYERIEHWLEGRISARIMPEAEFQQAKKDFLKSHPECLRRKYIKEQRRTSFRPGREYSQGLYQKLCALAGCEFKRTANSMWRSLKMIHPDLSDRPELATGFETSDGDAYMFLLCEGPNRMRFRAALYRIGTRSRLTEIAMPELTFRHWRQAMR
jgi:hypothetical protein